MHIIIGTVTMSAISFCPTSFVSALSIKCTIHKTPRFLNYEHLYYLPVGKVGSSEYVMSYFLILFAFSNDLQ